MAKSRRKPRIYILPTGFGALFLSGALAMILIGSAYQNNLVNMLAFFMLSLVFVAMIQTHNNLKDIGVAGLSCEGGFAGREFLVTTTVQNEAKLPRFNIESRLKKIKPVNIYESPSMLTERGSLKLRSSYPAMNRGRHHINSVRISSIFPLGLFEAWTWLETSADYFVYPEPKGSRPLPRSTESPKEQRGGGSGGDDFHHHRRYQLGDSQHHIDWKAVARGRPKLIKEFNEGAAPQSTVLDWHTLDGLDTEARLCQLAKWIEDARLRKIPFSLKIPNLTTRPGKDREHSLRCLEALAEYREGSLDAPSR